VPAGQAHGSSAGSVAPGREGSADYTLRDLLAESDLGLTLVAGDGEGLDRQVVGAHAVEAEDPTRFLDEGWVMLTTGLNTPEGGAAQRRLISELEQCGIAALGFAAGVVHDAVPVGLVDAARRADFPVFQVPVATELRDIVARVHANVASEEYRSYGRLPALVQYLLDAMSHESPRDLVVERLGEFLRASVAIIDRNRNLVVATQDLDWPRLLSEVGDEMTAGPVQTAEYHGLIRPVGEGDRARNNLLVLVPVSRKLHPLMRSAAKAAVPLLATIEDLSRAAESRNDAVRRATMELLLNAQAPFELGEADARAHSCGFTISDGARVLAAQLAPEAIGAANIEDVLLEIENGLLELTVPFLATVQRETACILVPSPVDEEVMNAILSAHDDLRVGVGRQITGAEAVLHSWADAKLSLAHPPRSASDARQRVMRYDELDLDVVLVNELPLERLRPKIERWLEPLHSNKLVYETLVEYFNNDFDVARTARAMNLHHNSVRYRLLRAEEAIGAPLRSAATIVSLHIALLVEGRHPPTAGDTGITGGD
jgi:Purine catabolism regulatory protein-like family/PucR C-terminal helix-turn-helix domain/GGDEF-like domain